MRCIPGSSTAMCFGSSGQEDPALKKSRDIEKQLREDERRLTKEVKLLLLGESTLLCRTKIVYPFMIPRDSKVHTVRDELS